MAAACDLADFAHDVKFALQHAGMLGDTSQAGRDEWARGMAALAARPNVFAKLSGFGTFIRRNDPAHVAWLVQQTVALFGAGRCLWGSNFPIEKLWTDYPALIGAHRDAAAGLPEADRRAIFHDTAARLYRV
jgi:predicted TIM-barrel fold metal-dependent hydrolase